MRELRFVGLDDAGTRLLFTLDGEDANDQTPGYAALVDTPLVEATRRAHGWHGRASDAHEGQADGQVETTTQALAPREIQARVRAGESPADLAEAAGVDVTRIERFARPVLQEREHVASAAQQVVVRTGALDGPLGEVVADRLAHVVTDSDVAWDAWRREDGRWTISLDFRDDVQDRTARWSFDPTTNSVIVDDETARWLTEGTPAPAPTQAPLAPPKAPRARRLLSVPDLTPEPAAAAVAPAPVEDEVAEIAEELAELGLQPVAAPDDESLGDQQTAFDLAAEPEAPAPAPEPEAPAAEAAPIKKRKASKRASVPSWDDIVFGARKPNE